MSFSPVRVASGCWSNILISSDPDLKYPRVPKQILSVHTRKDFTGSDAISVFISFNHEYINLAGEDSDKWTQFDSAVRLLKLRLLLGFNDRERMLHFATAVVHANTSSLSLPGDARYVLARMEKRQGDRNECAYWYQASLESDELQGASGSAI